MANITDSIIKGRKFTDYDEVTEVADTDTILIHNGEVNKRTSVKTLVTDKATEIAKKLLTTSEESKIYGVKRKIGSKATALIRTDDAFGMSFKASIGQTAGYSDFDTVSLYKKIHRLNVTNDVFVAIPKYYFKRYKENGYVYLKISESKQEGYSLPKAFDRPDGERECIYVGAYEMGAGYVSRSGLAPLVNLTRSQFRNGAMSRGNDYHMIDKATRDAVNMLILVEIANLNAQLILGSGNSSTSATIATGGADLVANLTGRADGTDTSVAVCWRGLENWYANVWEITDGLNFYNGTYYFTNNFSAMADDTSEGYEELSYVGATNWSSSYITELGIDEDYPDIMMPTKAEGGSATTFYADGVWSSTGWRVLVCGGDWGSGGVAGLFASTVSDASSDAYSNYGSRLLYAPVTPVEETA